ncbi:MAG TPA: thiamine pyrophosphate-dependent enzyme, partial [Pirellulales bacterium]|nr:thiamine pyrophosphate-dependent enzyme [Pirellulales bacterium]
GGPMFLEFATYRWREHCGPNFDNTLGYRTEKEFATWKAKCPIDRYVKCGLNDGWLSPADIERWTNEIDSEFAAAIEFAKSSPWPEASTMIENVYAEGKGTDRARRAA